MPLPVPNFPYPRLLLLLPGWLAFMVYLPALANGLVWDDIYFLQDLPYLRDPAFLWQQLSTPLVIYPNYFRPLPLLSFALEAWLGGGDPFLFHLGNLLFHAGNTTLLVLLVRRLISGPAAAWAACGAGLLFGLHPALAESVCWVSDRFDLILACLLMMALLLDSGLWLRRSRGPALAGLFLLALLCKETAILLPPLLLLWRGALLAARGEFNACWREALLGRVALRGYAWLAAALVLYLALRHAALGSLYRAGGAALSGDLLAHLLLVGKSFASYGLLALWPFDRIGPVHPVLLPLAPGDIGAWLGLAAAVASTLAVLWLLLGRGAAALLLAAALLCLAPVSNLLPLAILDNLVHDRYLLLPLLFALMAIAVAWAGWCNTVSRRWLSAAVFCPWLAASAITLLDVVPQWQSNLSLWRWAFVQQPDSRTAVENLLGALAVAGEDAEVLRLGGEALARRPDSPKVMHDMALALMHQGRLDQAERLARAARDGFRNDDLLGRFDQSEALNLIAYLHMQRGQWDAAEVALQEAIGLTPHLTRPHFNLAMIHYERGRQAAGDAEIAFVLRYDPPPMAALHRRLARERQAQIAQRALSR